MNDFGICVKTFLIEHGLKQKDIADKLGKSRSAISQTLSDDNISLIRMKEIANVLNCDLELVLKQRVTTEVGTPIIVQGD